MSDSLNVYLHADKVGRLWLDAGRRFVFQYDPDWLAHEPAVPLSLALPLRADVFGDDRARPFFVNLLPESDLRRMIARKLGLSEQNDFALLEAVGGECAGAVSVSPDDSPPVGEGGYRTLDDDALNALIADLPKRPMLAGEQGIRLSLAGAQNKLPVYFDGERVSLPLGTAPSSHILKPPIAQHPHTVRNEAFCMRLAARLKLPVPAVTILHKAEPLYLIERYDRERNAQGRVVRLHQEDFCQALGVAPDMKYEKEGGPGLKACFTLLRNQSIQPVQDLRVLLGWVMFNYLIGNADAHAKNISLMLTAQGPKLAPFYDLMSTVVYPELTERLAMKIGGEDRPDWIIGRRWEQLADDIGVGFKLIRQRLLAMGEALTGAAASEAADFQVQHGECVIIERIRKVIGRRSRKVQAVLKAQQAQNP